MVVAVSLCGCGGSPTTSSQPKDGESMLNALRSRIDQLGGQDAYPVVPLDLFFGGNQDEASFAPNLVPHPGMATIYDVLRAIRDRPEVSDVVVQIDEVLDGDEWPFAPAVYVITKADAQDVYQWAEATGPDPYDPSDVTSHYGWLEYAGRTRATPPPGAPEVPDGHRVVILYWD